MVTKSATENIITLTRTIFEIRKDRNNEEKMGSDTMSLPPNLLMGKLLIIHQTLFSCQFPQLCCKAECVKVSVDLIVVNTTHVLMSLIVLI